MYRAADGTLVLSPSDLTAFLACGHLTQLERRVAAGELERPERHDPELEVLRRRGDEHERKELERLEALGLSVVRIESRGSHPDELRAAEADTVAAMRAGADVVYQATFFDGRWRGHADFLLKVDVPGGTALGDWGYEVADTKLARRAKPEALLQLCCYAEQVARIQGGVWPEEVEVVTGLGERSRHRIADVSAYYGVAKARLEAAVDGPALVTYPDPVAHCAVCPWAESCDARRRADDHLSLVAGVRSDMVVKLADVGVATAAQLAASPIGLEVPRMGLATADRLRHQARLQLEQRADGRIHHELLDEDGPSRGLASLPAPSPGDVFFDLEGDPFAGEVGLEYLWGAWADGRYTAWWAHSPAAERAALEAFVDWVLVRLAADPGMHVYHYAAYERSALTRLAARYATREAEVDRLLRGEVLVDLYRVVRQGLRVSTEGYGLKKLEPLWLSAADRAGEVESGGSSIVAYEDWLDSGDPGLLQAIAAYNEVDCRSTAGLRAWLEERRTELEAARGEPLPRPEPESGEPAEAVVEEDEASAELVARLLDGVPPSDPSFGARTLLAGLVGWHRREAKPEWWAWYDRLDRTDAELVNDHESIGELEYEGVVDEYGRSLVHRYRFDPAQEHKVSVGDTPADPRTERSAGKVVAIDPVAGTVDLARGKANDAPHPRSLVPAQPIGSTVLRESVARVARWVADHGVDDPSVAHRAVRDLLLGRPPRVRGVSPGAPLLDPGEAASDAARRLAIELDGGCLAVQGPPGSGKTFTGAALIVDLVRAGHVVGVTASSHKAIGNLLDAVCRRAADEGVSPRILQRADDDNRCTAELVRCASNDEIEAALAAGDVDVVAGTAWLFARRGMAGTLRTLVVDEAGQLSLANVVAVSPAAQDVVLLGDPQQLAQPSKGTHPPGVGASALEHVLGEHATVPPERGLFLDTTYRMHPDVCRFVSELAYDGRLEPDPACGKQGLAEGPVVGGAGVRWLPAAHVGNRTRSTEEADAVAGVIDALLGRPWTDPKGQQGWLTLDDVLVIAPYNAQVAALAAALPPGARVGTVDRFQGQEAPVVVYSLAASSADDVPRGLSFLYSRNRLNVAVSRARALAVVVGSPTLLTARCRTPAQLALVNGLCRYVELAQGVRLAHAP